MLSDNDEHATSRGDCRLYMHKDPFRHTPVSVEGNFASSLFFDAAAPPSDRPGYIRDTPPGATPQSSGQYWVVERLLERLPEHLVTFATGVVADASQVRKMRSGIVVLIEFSLELVV